MIIMIWFLEGQAVVSRRNQTSQLGNQFEFERSNSIAMGLLRP